MPLHSPSPDLQTSSFLSDFLPSAKPIKGENCDRVLFESLGCGAVLDMSGVLIEYLKFFVTAVLLLLFCSFAVLFVSYFCDAGD